MAPTRSSDVDNHNDGSWDSDDEDTPSRELEVCVDIFQYYSVLNTSHNVYYCTTLCAQLSLILEQGVGISLINSVPEELLFASLTGIRVNIFDLQGDGVNIYDVISFFGRWSLCPVSSTSVSMLTYSTFR